MTKGFTVELTCLQGNALPDPVQAAHPLDIERLNVDPYRPAAGAYQGLFNGGEGIVSATASVVRQGNQLVTWVTGVAAHLGQSARFSTTLNSQGEASIVLPAPLNGIQLGISSTDGGASLVFSMRGSGWASPVFMGDQLAGYNARTNPAPVYGAYTAAMTGPSDGAYYDLSTRPTFSVATAKVSTGGVLTLAMILGDGTAVTASGGLRLGLRDDHARPHAILNAPLYAGKGWLRGDVGFNSTLGDGNDFASSMTWSRPRIPGARYYPDGFVVQTTLAGQRYTAPARGVRAMPGLDSTGAINLALSEHFDVTPSITANCWWLVNNQINSSHLVNQPAGLRAAFNVQPATGLITGSILYPAAFAAPVGLRAVILQNTHDLKGFYPVPMAKRYDSIFRLP